jgi:hypothetical protein
MPASDKAFNAIFKHDAWLQEHCDTKADPTLQLFANKYDESKPDAHPVTVTNGELRYANEALVYPPLPPPDNPPGDAALWYMNAGDGVWYLKDDICAS